MAKHDSKMTAAAVKTNDAELASRIASAVEQADDPDRRSRLQREQHRGTPAYKAARDHSREALGAVRESLVQLRRVSGELTDEDAAALVKAAGDGVTARSAERLRAAAREMIDAANVGDFNAVDEAMRAGVVGAADAAPVNFERPASDEKPMSDVLAAIPRQ
jgi:hypothetical protein